MKQIIQPIPAIPILSGFLLAVLLLNASCRKENKLAPSDQDENYFVIKDNPTDPIDHAIYQFYVNTGIASFYNDTIYKRRIADSAGLPRYAYITLSLSYSLLGTNNFNYKPLSSNEYIPAVLGLLKTQLISKIPEGLKLPSILFVDSLQPPGLPIINKEIVDGWTSYHGFNTVAIQLQDVAIMNNEQQRTYIASILAGIADKRITDIYSGALQKNFFSISRTVGNTRIPELGMLQTDIYIGLPFVFYMDPSATPEPEELGFLKYISNNLLGIIDPLYLKAAPSEADDLRAYLTAVFLYSTQAFNTKYANDAIVLQKFTVIKKLAEQVGFRFPD